MPVLEIRPNVVQFFPAAQSLVQARKAGIASSMAARSSIKDEELVSVRLFYQKDNEFREKKQIFVGVKKVLTHFFNPISHIKVLTSESVESELNDDDDIY